MPENVLMITAIAGAENCAAILSKQFQLTVETASSRREGLAALRRREYLLVVIDESLLEPEDDGTDALFKHTGLAIPLEINFAISGCGRLVREVRAALGRRERERELAARAAASLIQSELRDVAAGLLLQSQLALAEGAASPATVARLTTVVELAEALRQRLETNSGAQGRSSLQLPAQPGQSIAGDDLPSLRPASQEALPEIPRKPLIAKDRAAKIVGRELPTIQ